jgi:hypothetical protein
MKVLAWIEESLGKERTFCQFAPHPCYVRSKDRQVGLLPLRSQLRGSSSLFKTEIRYSSCRTATLFA